MRITIDGVGRVVIPKPIRDELGLAGGEELEIALVDGRIEMAPTPTPVRLEERDGHWVAVPEGQLPPLTPDLVRETLERIRR